MMGSIMVPPGAQTEPHQGWISHPAIFLPRNSHYLGTSGSAAVSWGHEARGHVTKSEYQELAEFIALRFDRNDKRFDGIDERFDAMDERLHRVGILGEETRHQIQIVAEAVTGLDQRFAAFRSEVAGGFEEHRNLLRTTYLDLDRRVTRLEGDQRN